MKEGENGRWKMEGGKNGREKAERGKMEERVKGKMEEIKWKLGVWGIEGNESTTLYT